MIRQSAFLNMNATTVAATRSAGTDDGVSSRSFPRWPRLSLTTPTLDSGSAGRLGLMAPAALLLLLACISLLATPMPALASTASCAMTNPSALAAVESSCDAPGNGHVEVIRDGAQYPVGTRVTGPCSGDDEPPEAANAHAGDVARTVLDVTEIDAVRPRRNLGGKYGPWVIEPGDGCRPLRLSKAGLYSAHVRHEEGVFEFCVPLTDSGGDDVHPARCDPNSDDAFSYQWVTLSYRIQGHL